MARQDIHEFQTDLAREVQSRLYADPALKRGAVAVEVKEGVVSLTGTVPDEAIEDIRRLVQSTQGVKEVDTKKLKAAARRPPQ